jgi:large subunit ribosomal protein L24
MAKNRKCLKYNCVGVRTMQDTKRVKNPGKQRKMLFNAPAHIRHKLMSAPLSRELSASKGAKTLPVRRGDTILIKRGDNKGFEGKISRVDLKAYRIYIEGLTREKVDGTNIFLPIHPSKVEIRNLNLDDKWRKEILARKKTVEKPVKEKPKPKLAKKVEKAPAKIEKVKEEKPVEVTTVKEEAAPEVAREQAPAEEIPKEMLKADAKKPVAKKASPPKKQQAPTKQEKAVAKKAVKPTATAKKAPNVKKTEEKEVASKPRAKKTSEKGGQ